ncbi:S8 family peptidase [Clostridium sp.]|uniref:S8 family peptidase n=1 Tax=Clostridium sp. TaxID=1506 RepID=UPI002FCA9069
MGYSNYLKKINREIDEENIITPLNKQLEVYYLSGNYDSYLVEYEGDLAAKLAVLDYADAYITEKSFAIIFVKKGMLNQLLEAIPKIMNIEPYYVYTLSELYSFNSENKNSINKGSLTLDGEGVIVGIIGTELDYLNPRFLTEDGKSRIITFWDQSDNTGPRPSSMPYGTEYSKENINAIIASNTGELPNESVSPRYEKSFGTALAGIIGGRKLTNKDPFSSIAPKCEFALVNLKQANKDFLKSIGIEKSFENIYQGAEIYTALKYLSDFQQTVKKPMVVYLPLGSNSGGRSGDTILERYIDVITERTGFIVVTNTGAQGHGRTHSGRVIKETGATENSFVEVDELENSLYLSIYTRTIDLIDITITSPTGETIEKFTVDKLNQILTNEEKGIPIDYFVQEKPNGIKNLEIIIRDVKSGIWKISLLGGYIVSGIVDIWLHPEELLHSNTRFFRTTPYTTLLTPGTAMNIITNSYYGTQSKTIAIHTGRGFPRMGETQPVVSCPGFNMLTVSTSNNLGGFSGAAIAGAILAGAVALVYQWAFVQGNYLELNPKLLRQLLISSTIKEENIIYPSEEWGYGRLDFQKLKETLNNEKLSSNSITDAASRKNGLTTSLYISIPSEIYFRLK